jgi:hypothetical protein
VQAMRINERLVEAFGVAAHSVPSLT